MSEPMAFIWKCEKGHESAHSEMEIRSLKVHPRCPIKLADGSRCWARLSRRIAPYPALNDGSDAQ